MQPPYQTHYKGIHFVNFLGQSTTASSLSSARKLSVRKQIITSIILAPSK